MVENEKIMDQCSNDRASEGLLNTECRLITSEYTSNNTTGMMDYTNSIVNFNENLLDQNPEQSTVSPEKGMERYGVVGNNHIREIHSVGVRDESPFNQETDKRSYTDWEPDNTMNLRASQPSTSNTMEITVYDDRNILKTQLDLQNTAACANTDKSTERSTTIMATEQVEDTIKRHTRSSNRNQRYACYSNSREKILRTRYPDLSKLQKKAENNCPDLDNPFWENIETFSCRRSMPICVSCHSSHCEVKEAVKCGYCVKAYFELMCESELGDRKDVIDEWD
ncbi:hypothetical protein QAD02_018053 [Eretmocerus hayati]|uniref:Uncharacterized protein n=1 Tax=Eretmocerus hayati TaxID=131215 RepID=A0ACC2PGV7_9HYME|nr:hypothetical protein QAD02_018053 [Eretmocerus hayati]